MKIFFVIMLVVFLVLYLLSRGKYTDDIKGLEKGDFPLKDFIPMGLFIMDKLKYKYRTRYDARLLTKVGEIFGIKRSRFYLRIHWANKVMYMLLSLLVISLFGAGSDGVGPGFVVFLLGTPVLLFYLADNDLKSKVEKRHRMIRYQFPDFLNKLILLINAGMTVTTAVEKIVTDQSGKGPLYQELEGVHLDVKAGKSQLQAFEDFARRCKVPEITKFASVIIQNIRKGNAEMVTMLRLQSTECWEMRKSVAKQLGEEASTKLLFPMMIMFVAILLIVMVPAVLQLKNL